MLKIFFKMILSAHVCVHSVSKSTGSPWKAVSVCRRAFSIPTKGPFGQELPARSGISTMLAEAEAWFTDFFTALIFAHSPEDDLQRPHWIPYFDDVQAIIFLAPLAFNLMLEEDSKVNRLVSSLVPASDSAPVTHLAIGRLNHLVEGDLQQSALRRCNSDSLLQ